MKHAVLPLLGVTLVAGLFSSANAATFAQFTQGGNNTKIFALTGAGPNQVFETTGGNFVAGIQFVFPVMDPTDPYALHAADGVDGDGPDDLVGRIIKAKLKLTAVQSSAGSSSAGNAQESFKTIMMQFVADGAQTIGGDVHIANGANLLTVKSGFITGLAQQGGVLAGKITGPSHPTKGSPGLNGADTTSVTGVFDNVVTFTSDFINFTGAADKNYGLSFSNATPYFGLHGGFPNFLNDFTANGTGTFSATFVPEPGTTAMFIGLMTSGEIMPR